MKRIVWMLCLLMFCLTCTVPAVAMEAVSDDSQTEKICIYDFADLLTYEEWESMNNQLTEFTEKYDFEAVVMIDEELYKSTAEESANAIYDEMEFGVGANKDGCLFYIGVEAGEYYILTNGYGTTAINESGISYLKREVEPHLKDRDFAKAVEAYVSVTDELVSMAKSGTPYEETDWGYVAIVIGCAVAIPLILAFIMMMVQLSKMKTAVANDYAANYEKDGSYHLDFAKDVFLYSRVTKVKKENNNSTSSSGSSRGGGGGSF
ncbi:MAG: TPM domain-containing protein [Ruminococcaceae bacterium]|nr:TPM domain-containing protein [Oscillospiraceae bacterium]